MTRGGCTMCSASMDLIKAYMDKMKELVDNVLDVGLQISLSSSFLAYMSAHVYTKCAVMWTWLLLVCSQRYFCMATRLHEA